MTQKPLYAVIAATLHAYINCEESGNFDWQQKHEERIEALCKRHLPSGSGFDSGSILDLDLSTPNRLVIRTDFHNMNEHGFYDGWTEHQVIVSPHLAYGFTLRVTGRNKRQIKDYIADTFHSALSAMVDEYETKGE